MSSNVVIDKYCVTEIYIYYVSITQQHGTNGHRCKFTIDISTCLRKIKVENFDIGTMNINNNMRSGTTSMQRRHRVIFNPPVEDI